MKKIALTSLLAVMAVSGADAAAKNVLDGNPLYMPQKHHFVSETSLESHTQGTRDVTLGERFGVGFTDSFMLAVETSMSENNTFSSVSWNDVEVDATYRLIGSGSWKMDLGAGYGMGPMRAYGYKFLDKDLTTYAARIGVRGGYVHKDWTLAGHFNLIYANSEMFNWADDKDMWQNHIMNLGFTGFWQMSDYWSWVVSADYFKILDRYGDPEAAGYWDVTAGLNLNIDTTKYIGLYITKEIDHTGKGQWEDLDGFGFGAKFGVDF